MAHWMSHPCTGLALPGKVAPGKGPHLAGRLTPAILKTQASLAAWLILLAHDICDCCKALLTCLCLHMGGSLTCSYVPCASMNPDELTVLSSEPYHTHSLHAGNHPGTVLIALLA